MRLKFKILDGFGRESEVSGEASFNLSYRNENLRVDYLYRSLDKEGPVTVLASGEDQEIGDFEKILLEENKKRSAP